jgi:hypothetical protein
MPYRVGVIPLQFAGHSIPALKYFVLHLNTIQDAFEFEMLPNNQSKMLQLLESGETVDRNEMRQRSAPFAADYIEYIVTQGANFKVSAEPPRHLIIVSPARFHDNFYTMQHGSLTILALGNWNRAMAPPSLLEFVYILVVRYALSAAYPRLLQARHYATRGCLFDFTATLADLRFKVLNAHLCSTCATALQEAASADILTQVKHVLAKTWVGQPGQRGTPAAIMAKLGYNLFLATGVRATRWEKFKARLEEEWLKQVLDFVAKLTLAAALFWLGLKNAG